MSAYKLTIDGEGEVATIEADTVADAWIEAEETARAGDWADDDGNEPASGTPLCTIYLHDAAGEFIGSRDLKA